MKHVLYVSPLPPPAGGIANWTRILTERGLPEGWRFDLVDTRTNAPIFGDWRTRLNMGQVRRWARIFRDVDRALRTHRPDLVHFNLSCGLGVQREALLAALCRARGVPYALHYRGDLSLFRTLPRLHPVGLSLRRAARAAALNLALDPTSRDDLLGWVGDRSTVVQVPNYYDDREIVPADPPKLGPDQRPVVAFVGGLTLAKGAHLLAEAARALPGVDFHLIGARYDETAAALDAAPRNLTVFGELDHAGVIRALRSAHAFAFPTDHREGFPNAVTEAMAVGLPVVTCPRGALAQMVEHGRGGVVLAERTVSALVAGLRAVLDNPDTRAGMGAFNQKKAQAEYAYPRVIDRLTTLYGNAIDRPAAHRADRATAP